MVPKVEMVLFQLFLLVLFVIQPSTTTKSSENEKLVKLTEKFDALQADMSQLQSQVETLTKKLQLKLGDTAKQSCTSSDKERSLSRKKRQGSSTEDATQSCQELRKKGHFADGVYHVPHPTEPNKIEAVSCEFIAANNVKGEPIGIIDLKTKTVIHFQVQRSAEFDVTTESVITFEKTIINYGDAMNMANGIFTAPVAGIYHFSFSGMTKAQLQILLKVTHVDNRVENAAFTSADASSINNAYGISVSLSSSVYLREGDKVSVYKSGTGSLSSESISNTNTFFSGWLVEEIELMS